MTSGWGYGSAYYNPYVTTVATTAVPYDYSQPVVVNNYVSNDGQTVDASTQAPPQAPESDPSLKQFDEGLAQFKAGDYKGALANFDAALKQFPGDPVIHEVRALTLFALGDYQSAAAALNSFLSSAPGMDWTTMSSLYGNVKDYETQLRALEKFARENPTDPSSHFVLAYHYLVTGAKDAAIRALKVVVANQPKDYTAKRMLDALVPPEAAANPASAPAGNPPAATADEPEIDLVGAWQAKAGDTTITLTITEDFQFTWKAEPAGKPPVELKGELSSSGNELALSSKDQGSMAGTAKALTSDKWTFSLSGAPPSDPGLTFERVKK